VLSVVFVERRHLVKLVKERIAEPSRRGRDGSLDGRGQVKLSDLPLHNFESGRLQISIRTLSTQNRNAFEQFCPKHFSRNGKKILLRSISFLYYRRNKFRRLEILLLTHGLSRRRDIEHSDTRQNAVRDR